MHLRVDIVPTDVGAKFHDGFSIFQAIRLHLEESIADVYLNEILVVVAEVNAHRYVGGFSSDDRKTHRVVEGFRHGGKPGRIEANLVLPWRDLSKGETAVGICLGAFPHLAAAPVHQNQGSQHRLGNTLQIGDLTSD